MDANKKKKIVIWVSLTMLLGVGGYFAYTKLIKPKLDEKKAKKAAELAANTTLATSGNSAPSGGGNTLPPVPANPFKSKAELTAFQNWVLTKYPLDKAILGSTGADGDWGRNSWNAYTKYFALYSKTPTGTTTTTTGVPRKVYSLDYNNKVFKAPNDILPVFLAGKGEYLGDKVGSAKDYYGTDYIMYYTPDRKNMYYIKYSNAEIKA
jgi:hypothetical protein